jgi:hypothetical protein
MLNGVVGVTLLCSIAAALMPVGIMLFGGPKGAAKPKKSKKKDDDDAGDSVVGLEEVDDYDSASGVSDAYADLDDSGELTEDFGSSESSDLLDGGESDESGEMMDAYDDEQTGRHQVSDEWDVSDSDQSDEFEFDDALSDDELDFDFEDEEK